MRTQRGHSSHEGGAQGCMCEGVRKCGGQQRCGEEGGGQCSHCSGKGRAWPGALEGGWGWARHTHITHGHSSAPSHATPQAWAPHQRDQQRLGASPQQRRVNKKTAQPTTWEEDNGGREGGTLRTQRGHSSHEGGAQGCMCEGVRKCGGQQGLSTSHHLTHISLPFQHHAWDRGPVLTSRERGERALRGMCSMCEGSVGVAAGKLADLPDSADCQRHIT